MITLDAAQRILEQTLAGFTLASEKRAVADALGRTLVADQLSRLDLPPFDKSAMDGYAVLAGDERNSYRPMETVVAAGSLPTVALTPGTAVKVMTGAPVPRGTGRVIKVEDVQLRDGLIEVHTHSRQENICLQAEDVRRGDLILPAGTRLTPLDVANLIGCGIAEVEVFRPLRAAVFPTGDELADDPLLLRPGMIMNSNGPLLAGLARQWSIDVVCRQTLPDDRAAIADAIRAALPQADLLLLSGGVSVGDFDYVTLALRDAGLQIHFAALALKPGKPTTYATAPGKAVFGLPGNPVAAYLMFHLLVLSAAAHMTHAQPPLRELTLRLCSDYRRRTVDRSEYIPCQITENGSLQHVDFHGSAHLTALAEADGFFIVPQGVAACAAGELVRFLPLRARS